MLFRSLSRVALGLSDKIDQLSLGQCLVADFGDLGIGATRRADQHDRKQNAAYTDRRSKGLHKSCRVSGAAP